MLRALAVGAAVLLGGCVSTEMKGFVGKPIEEAQLNYGPPAQVVDMPDGSRAYQFRYGGGAVFVPGQSTTAFTPTGGGAGIATTTATPGMALNNPGCLLTFIARQQAGAWLVTDYRVPKQLAC